MCEIISLGGNCSVAYNLKTKNRYPFDWCSISIRQINDVLENDFDNFSILGINKISKKHKVINEKIETEEPSYILKNFYNIKFAHEITEKYQLADFKNKLDERIIKFKNLEKPMFVRLETASRTIKYFQKEYCKLIKNLDSMFKNYKLVLILNVKYANLKLPGNVTIFYFKDYSLDWKYPNLDWDTIFNCGN